MARPKSRSRKTLPVVERARRKRDASARPAPPVVTFVSLGCAKNLVDSESMLGRLAESGCAVTGSVEAADTVVVNTCGFLESSRSEALSICREMAAMKDAGRLKRLVVAGCLVQRDGEKLLDWVPQIDALVGVNNRDDIVRAVWRLDRDASVSRYMGEYHAQPWSDQARLQLTPRHYAYVRVSEGCDQKCTFCTIPSIRGPMHCKSPEQIVNEGRELIAAGSRELLLIGQDTTSYGADIGYKEGLGGLLRTLDREWEGADWIRLMYVYPSIFTDAMIDAIAESPRIVKYIDMPLQHISDRVLRAMHRRVTRSETESLLERLRGRIPGVAIRTTFIVGFPGETEAEFDELLAFVREQRFDAAGAFKYSREPETPAGRMKEQVAEEVKRERRERFMRVQQEVAFENARAQIGRSFEVVVDRVDGRRAGTDRSAPEQASPLGIIGDIARENVGESGLSHEDEFGHGESRRGGAHAVARSALQAPDVDPVCILRGSKYSPGQRLEVKCVASEGYDLVVEPLRTTRVGLPVLQART